MPKVNEPIIIIHVRVIDKIDLDKFNDLGCVFYSAEIELLNNTDSIIEFWSMTCSWQENWICSNDSVHLFNEGCVKNIPKLEKLYPREKINVKTTVCITNTTDSIYNENIKLGFVHIKKNEVSEDEQFYKVLFMKIKEHRDIIWSEPFKIEK